MCNVYSSPNMVNVLCVGSADGSVKFKLKMSVDLLFRLIGHNHVDKLLFFKLARLLFVVH